MNLSDLRHLGIRASLDTDGGLVLDAPKGAITHDLIERIRESKPGLIAELVLVKNWRVTKTGEAPFGLICVQGTTREELLERYPQGTVVEAIR